MILSHLPGVTRDATKEQQAKRLRAAREAAGFVSATDGWAEVKRATKSTVGKDAYIQHENGHRSLKNQAQAYATAFGVEPGWLLWGDGSALTSPKHPGPEALPLAVNRTVPLIGEVRAGAWTEIPADPVVEEEIPVLLPEYDRAQLFALRVVGRSMDQLYADGAVVIAGPVAEIGLRVGDIAVIRQHRFGLAETTLKEIVLEADGSYSLAPRSNDPTYKAIPLAHQPDADDGVEVIGVVVYSIDPTRRGRGPLVSM